MNEFLSMGGYGFYVWSSYGTVTLGLCLFYLHTKRSHKNLIKSLKQKHEAKN